MTDSFTLEDLYRLDPLLTEKVAISSRGCWVYTGYTPDPPNNYAIVMRSGRAQKGHRVTFALFNGPIPQGRKVLHRCDNPPCVNPAHLFLGSQGDNVQDMARKGRHGQSTLSNEQVAEIRHRVAMGEVQRHLAVEYGVQPSCVSRIVSGKRRV